MGCKSYYELKLSDFKKRALEHAIQTTQEISKEHYRAEILLERSEGKSINKISKEKGFTKKTVKRIIRKYKKNGLASLSDEARNRKDRNAKKTTYEKVYDYLYKTSIELQEGCESISELAARNNISISSAYSAAKKISDEYEFSVSNVNYKKRKNNVNKFSSKFNIDSIPNGSVEICLIMKDSDGEITAKSLNINSIFNTQDSSIPKNIDEYRSKISEFEGELRKELNKLSLTVLNEFSNSMFSCCKDNNKVRTVQMETMFGYTQHKVPVHISAGLSPNKRIWSYNLEECALGTVEKSTFRDAAWILNTTLGRTKEHQLSYRTLCNKKTEFGMNAQEAIYNLDDKEFENIEFSNNDSVFLNDYFNQNRVSKTERSSLTDQGSIDDIIENYNFNKETDQQIDPNRNHLDSLEYDPDQTSYVSIDGCFVPHQKEKRASEENIGEKTTEYVQNSVGTFHFGLRNKNKEKDENVKDIVYFNSYSNYYLCYSIYGAISCNDYLDKQIILFYDGEEDLIENFKNFFWWKRDLIIILDWYHITKMVREYLSIGLKNDKKYKDLKRKTAKETLSFLWLGRVNDCIQYLKCLDSNLIKNKSKINNLINYLEERKKYIVCYEIRKELGLPNSSNPVETAANLLVARRQKKKGSAWSYEGSWAMSTISTLKKNGQLRDFIEGKFALPSLR